MAAERRGTQPSPSKGTMDVANDEETGTAATAEEREGLLAAPTGGGGPSGPAVVMLSSSEGKQQKEAEAAAAASAQNKATKAFYRMVSFCTLVIIGSLTQLSFKLSQRDGKYEYNTASAMCVVELVKFSLASVQHYSESAAKAKGSQTERPFKIFSGTLRRLPARLYADYFLLAVSYAVYNQLIFAVMHLSDPGTFSLLKSFTPVLVGIINFQVTGMVTSELQWYCVLMQIFGIIPVMRKCGGELVTTPKSLVLIACVNCMGALNGVYNAKLIKDLKLVANVSVQNMVLYAYGTTLSFLGYFVLEGRSGASSFFRGYGHKGIWAVLVLNAFAGLTVSFVYRYGDAVLKTFATPLASAIVLYVSSLLMQSPLDVVQASGAGTVVLASLVYLRLPASKDVPSPSSGEDAAKGKKAGKSFLASLPYVQVAMLVCIVSGLAFIASHLYIFSLRQAASASASEVSNAALNSTATT